MRRSALVALVLALAGTGCATLRPVPSPASLPAGTTAEMDIDYGTSQDWEEAGLRVLFRRVINDSRCPVGTNCVWAGNAVVELVATRAKRSESFRLRIGPAAGDAGAVPETQDRLGFRFQVLELQPEPRPDTGPIDPQSYGVMVRVTVL